MVIQTVTCSLSSRLPAARTRTLAALVLAGVAALLAACAAPGGAAIAIGEPESGVVARLGRPTHVFEDERGRILEYQTGPFGQQTWFARIAADGRLVSYEQVLTPLKFATIQVDSSTKEDVLHAIGSPSETSYLALPKLEVWSYPYKESPVSDSVMHVHFDRAGVVRKMQNGPDFRRDPDPGGLFGNRFGGFRRH